MALRARKVSGAFEKRAPDHDAASQDVIRENGSVQ